MATLFPALASLPRHATPGERRLAHRLVDKLEDDYLCWYNVPLGPRQRHPDFVVLHPSRGLLVLEVKDWKRDQIRRIDRTSVSLLTDHGLKEQANPLAQARAYATMVVDLLARDPLLVVQAGRYQGQLILPWGYGVVLTNISRKAFDQTDLGEVIDPALTICQDEMTESVDAEAFQARLWAMFKVAFAHTLTLPQIDRIRWHLFPEVRVTQGSLLPEPTESESVPDLVRVMDLAQEQLARGLGEGHRIIHGVAGSGKTMILGYRAARLAQALSQPILVLCYNVALAAKLRQVIADRGLSAKVSVYNFHAWCMEQLRLYHVDKPEPGDGYFERLVQYVICGVDVGQIPRAQYGAVLIDEGHDFEPAWLQLVAQMVDPQSNSLLVLYDDAQSIYGKARRRKFSFASVGIDARGRTTILRLNYRNTAEVLAVAYEFARDVLTPEEAEEDGVPLVAPESAGRHGPAPEAVRRPSLKSEASFIADRLRQRHESGRPWNEMAVLYRARFVAEEVIAALKAAGIPFEWLQEAQANRRFAPNQDSVKVMTMHSSKGLEFPLVAIPGVGFMPYEKADAQDEARLLYVAMTRAMDELLLTWHRESPFAARLGAVCERVAA
jgi:hypothetical protein